MARRFVRVDLSEMARDFRPIAVEPGVPLADRSGSNAKILFRWLGGMAAEPVWEGDSVNFYVRDDHGGRLEEVVCQPIAPDDLEGPLKQDLATLRERLEKVRPETSTERALYKCLAQSFRDLVENPNRTDLDDYFFRYRDVNGRARLVWCWGFQRVDQEPAPAVVCTDPECNLLFVRRRGQSPKCPSCEALLATRPVRRGPRKRVAVLFLLLLLLVAAAAWWWLHPARLVASPENWSGPPGSRVEFRLTKTGLFFKEDVTHRAVAIVLDPQVARLDALGNAAVALSPGRTLVRFHLGDLKSDAILAVLAAGNPKTIAIEPQRVELGIGTTARLKIVGHYEDGTQADLTDSAEFDPQNDGIVFARDGLLEGLAQGNTNVTARYRASPEDDYLETSAAVSVAKIDFQSLDAAIEPLPVGVGRSSDLRIDAVAADGKRYSVLESSRLWTRVAPEYLAEVEGRRLAGRQAGRGKLAAAFDDHLTAGAEFEVAFGPGVDRLTVQPEKLNLVVGQIADLSIATPSTAPIRLASPDAKVVEITAGNRLVGRGEGSVKVEVIQGAERRTVDVAVTRAEFQSVAVEPSRVVVAVDDTTHPKVVARLEDGRRVELSPDVATIERAPSPRFATLDARRLGLHGVQPTVPSAPQSLGLRVGNHAAAAPVEVVLAPFRLRLSPGGPIELPLGQQMRLLGVATYSGGREVQVPGERMAWRGEPSAETKPGLEVRGDRVAALKPGGGPLPVFATYFGTASSRVTFQSVEADPNLKLRLEVDRTIRLAGETGAAFLAATGPKGDVELVPEMASFESSDPAVLGVDERSGAFRAAAPGQVELAARHAAAKERASLALGVFDPTAARLVFDPASVRVAVDEVVRLPLYLEVDDGGQPRRALLLGPGVGYTTTQPQAIDLRPPVLVGVRPAPPFEVAASYYPHLAATAAASVEVVPAAAPEAIRVVPASPIALAAGQSVTLRVEQQLPGGGRWQEVRPDAVSWTVPPALVWQPAAGGLRPAATVPEGAAGEFELKAEYGGRSALGVVAVGKDVPDPAAPGARLVVVREPEGEYLPLGARQRYSIVVEHEGEQRPAAGITWPERFENDYVRWEAPVLEAKQGGYQQPFRAEVGGRTVLWRTTTYEPARFDRPPPPSGDAPVAVKILSDQGPLVRFPVGAAFDDFRVEAHYADGFTRLVTRRATLRTPEPPQSAPVAASEGRLVGVRPGTTAVSAEFDGVAAQQPLGVEVSDQVDIDQIRLAPAPLQMLRGETIAMEAVGYKNNRSVGVLNALPGMVWRSSNPGVAEPSGPALTARGLGQASITAALGPVVSQPAAVAVVDSIAEELVADPKALRLRVGEAARIGTDLTVFRGDVDLSRQCRVTPALPGVVRYDPETGSLVGVAPGASAVTFALGDRLASVMVEVAGGAALADGRLVVEPAAGNLAVGQALPLRVFLVGPSGERIDRTDSAVLSSSDPGVVRMLGNRACAVGAGAATVTARLPETQNTAAAHVAVTADPITALVVDPSRLEMSVGDRARVRILGQATPGTHELFPQPDLTVAAAGPNPEAIRVIAGADVDAVAPGQAALSVAWRNQFGAEVPVSVTSNPWTDLRIEPAQATIGPGQPIVYQVTALRGGQRHVLSPEQGLEMFTVDREVAEVVGGTAVRGNQPGRTAVVAQLGNQRAEGVLSVAQGVAGVGDVAVVGPGGVGVYGPGYGYHGGPGYWRDGRWHGGWRDGVVVDGGQIGVHLPADVRGLRFVPDVLRIPSGSPGATARVVELLADGALGRDVSNDPELELTDPRGVVALEKTPEGVRVRPLQSGEAHVGARLGLMTADPMLVAVGDYLTAGRRLEVLPDPLIVWLGELGSFGSVLVNPGGGLAPIEVDYRITAPADQGVVAADSARRLRGLATGLTQVTITTVDPTGAYDGLSTTATVQVIAAERLTIVPAEIELQVGQATPPVSAMAQGADGMPYQVPAVLTSMDPSVLEADPLVPGRFVARGYGGTQVRAEYRGREAFAEVRVSGKRFVSVDTELNSGADDFDVTIRVLADPAEGPLEYRVYQAGAAPAETWVAAQSLDGTQQAVLRSPRMNYGPPGQLYQLILEARSAGMGTPQQYPLTFRLRPDIERVESPGAAPRF